MSSQARPGRERFYAHAYRAVDLKPGGPDRGRPRAAPGATVRGRVVGPDGQPVRDAWFFSRVILDPGRRADGSVWVRAEDRGHGHVRDGRFAICTGSIPTSEVPVYFLEPERKLGATARFSGQVGGERAGHRPARAVRHGHGAAGRSRRQAARSLSRRGPGLDGRHARAAVLGRDGEGRPPVRRRAAAVPDRPGQLRTATSSPTPRAGSPSRP